MLMDASSWEGPLIVKPLRAAFAAGFLALGSGLAVRLSILLSHCVSFPLQGFCIGHESAGRNASDKQQRGRLDRLAIVVIAVASPIHRQFIPNLARVCLLAPRRDRRM